MPEPELPAESSESASYKLEQMIDIDTEDLKKALDIAKNLEQINDANEQYMHCFQLLKAGGLAAEIPRLVVFGQQSMGKTTLLDFIMGGPLGYSSTDIGTRQPVVILITPSHSGNIEAHLNGKSTPIGVLSERIAALMCSQGDNISSTEMEVQLAVPGAVHAVFVDLPGIKDDSKSGAALTRSVVRNYVQSNPNDLYILVKKASDDPANWPWSLREFILAGYPKGLGLKKQQTVVVGTRAREFLVNEKNDVNNQDKLLERVNKRAVLDSDGTVLPLFLLELFSFSIEEKEKLGFIEKRNVMKSQMARGKAQIVDLLSNSYQPSSSMDRRQKLMDVFCGDKFKRDLNLKFKNLLCEQLVSLERRLLAKSQDIKKQLKFLSEELANHSPQTCREYIKLFLREFMQIVTDLVTGNYSVMRMADCGKSFLETFGGSLLDNLTEGNELALSIFKGKNQYSPDFLPKLMSSNKKSKVDIPTELHKGAAVRFRVSKDDSNMLGTVANILSAQPDGSGVVKDIVVSFSFQNAQNPSAGEQTQQKTLERSRIAMLIPLNTIPDIKVTDSFKCWRRINRSDNWVGVVPGVGTIQEKEVEFQQLQGGSIDGSVDEKAAKSKVPMAEIYVDTNMIRTFVPDTSLNHIAGEFSNSKLLNQLSLAHLGRWLKYHICNLEPDRKFSEHVLLQMMRSVRHVVDKADWEPLVADLLQANVKGGMMYVAKLASCAAAKALGRIIKAAFFEICRLIRCGELSPSLQFLIDNQKFMQEVEVAIEDFVVFKATDCSNRMRDLIFEQTHAIHFEMVEDFFDGCKSFESDFMNSSTMDNVTQRVKEMLAEGKSKLGIADIYSRSDPQGTPSQLIYNEVRIQFWVVKMLLAAPMTTKLYMHFVKDITDKSSHLASEQKHTTTSESAVEITFQHKLLFEEITTGNFVPRSDDNLVTHYNLASNIDELASQEMGLKRLAQFIEVTQDSVTKLKNQLAKRGGVNFLTRLDTQDTAEMRTAATPAAPQSTKPTQAKAVANNSGVGFDD